MSDREKPKKHKHEAIQEHDSKEKTAYGTMADILDIDKEEFLPKTETIQELHAQINELEKKVDEHKDKWMRAFAELENVRRIAKRDITNAHKFALEKFAIDLLGVVDSLEQGLEASAGSTGNQAIHDGLELTYKMFIDSLSKYGIEPINPINETFNPELHEAIGMEPTAQVKANTIVKVIQKGYLLNERVIRPARVVVAKAP